MLDASARSCLVCLAAQAEVPVYPFSVAPWACCSLHNIMITTLIPRPYAPILPASWSSFSRFLPGMCTIHLYSCQIDVDMIIIHCFGCRSTTVELLLFCCQRLGLTKNGSPERGTVQYILVAGIVFLLCCTPLSPEVRMWKGVRLHGTGG